MQLTDKSIFRKRLTTHLAKLLTTPRFFKPTRHNLLDHHWEAQRKNHLFRLIVSAKYRRSVESHSLDPQVLIGQQTNLQLTQRLWSGNLQ
jgi:hypothetical protein